MDIVTYALLNKRIKGLTSGIQSATVNGTTITFTMNDGTTQVMTFDQPEDGISVVDMTIDADNHLICIMSDGSSTDAGEIPVVSSNAETLINEKINEAVDEVVTDVLVDYMKTSDLNTKLEEYVHEDDVKIINVATIEDMIGLSTEELEGITQIIEDDSIRADKAWSSSKVYHDILKCLVDSKAYTLEQIGLNNTASYKVVSSIDDITEDRYIYLLDNGTNFDMYIIDSDTGLPTSIGDTSIDLSEFIKTVNADNRYAQKTDVEVLESNIGDVSTLGTNSKVVVDAINELIDGSVSVGNANTLDGLHASDFLSITGGTVGDGTIMSPITFKGKTTSAYTKYVGADGSLLGYLGFSAPNKPIYQGDDNIARAILHAGNYLNYAMSKPIILWENPDLTAEFPSQTISLNSEFANCKYYEIICIRRSSSSTGRLVTFSSGRIPQSKAVWLNLFTQYYYTRLSNIPSVSNCTITFNDCTAASTYGSATNDITDNTFCVPMIILGYKE